MPNLNEDFTKFVAKLPHTGFDLGRKFKFTAAPNMILPVFQQICNPGEKFRINCAASVQCQPIVRPCELNIRQKVDWFFVPMSMILTGFGNIMYGTNDYLTSSINYTDNSLGDPNQFPKQLMSMLNIITSPVSIANKQGSTFQDNFGTTHLPISRFDTDAKGKYRLLMHLGYNPHVIFGAYNFNSVSPVSNSFPSTYQPDVFPAFAAAYQAIYYNYYRNDDREFRQIRNYQLDFMMSGGQNTDVFNLRYHQRPKDYFTSLRVSPIMSVLNLRASVNGNTTIDYLNSLNDYLTPTLSRNTGDEINGLASTYDVNPSSVDGGIFNSAGVYPRNINKYYSNTALSQGTLNTSMLRSLFAVEKLARITGRAQKNYDSQVLAHLGVKVPRDIKHELTFIGGFDGSFDVHKIASTSNTAYDSSDPASTNLGELAGNAVGGLGGKPLSFEAPCHGILMGVYYAVPEFSYPLGTMIDKQTMLTSRLDLFIPEFDRLGDQPMYVYEQHTHNMSDNALFLNNSITIGWQRRYEQYKRKYDVHSLAFTQPFLWDGNEQEITQTSLVNTWSPWVLGRFPFNNFYVEKDSNLDIIDASPRGYDFMGSPTDLNDIFVQPYKTDFTHEMASAPWLIFQTDPFMVALNTDVKMVSAMSVTGEPELD